MRDLLRGFNLNLRYVNSFSQGSQDGFDNVRWMIVCLNDYDEYIVLAYNPLLRTFDKVSV